MVDKSASVEVTVSWAGNPLDTTSWSEDRTLTVGPSDASWFSFPRELLAVDHALLTPTEGGYRLVAPAGATLNVASASGAVTIAVDGVLLERGMTAELRLGAFEIFVRAGDRVEETMPRVVGEYRWVRWVAVAAGVHGIVLGMFAAIPPGAAALNTPDAYDAARYIEVHMDALAEPEPERTPVSSGGGGEPGMPAGEEGGNEADHSAESGTPAPVRQHARRQPVEVNAETVSRLGVLPALQNAVMSFGDDQSPFTAGNAHPGDGGMQMAERLAMPGGPNFGGLPGPGIGVGSCNPRIQDCGAGIIHSRFHTEGDDYGRDVGIPDPTRNPPGGPEFRVLPPEVIGSLSREQVRLTVRRHVNEVRFCYEQGLQRQPGLEGRVAVQFIISPTGTVQSSSVSNSTVNDTQVSSCVSNAVSRWTFPSSESPTGVTYPFLMQSN